MDVVATDSGGPAEGERSLLRRVPRIYIHRGRLSYYFESDARVVLVAAPAGTGKTTAIAGWCATSMRPTRWVDVDDNQPIGALWRAVGEAFGVTDRAIDADPTGPGDEPVGDLVIQLCDALRRALHVDHVLVIDGLDNVGDTELASVELFLRRLPEQLRVVIASRRPLSSAVDATRMSGELVDVGYEELRFTVDESSTLAAELAPECDDGFVDALIAWADGWAAPLTLGARASRRYRGDTAAALSAAQQLVHDYVCHEMVTAEDKSLVDFLIDTAVVGRATAALSNAITETDLGTKLLERAEERGMFVSPIGVHGWYEMHPVFREVLIHEAEGRHPDRMMACRRRAADWLQQHGETVAALELWLEAGEYSRALHLLVDRHVQLYAAGLKESIRDYVHAITHGGVPGEVGDMIDLASCQVFVDRGKFLRSVDEAVWWAHREGHIDEMRQRQLHALQAVVALIEGDFERGRTAAHQAVDGCESWLEIPIVRTTWNDMARFSALDERWDDVDDTIREITIRLRCDPVRTLVLESTRSLGEALAGRPVDALRVAAGIRTSLHAERLSASRAELSLAEVIAQRELGDAPDARVQLEALAGLDVEPTTCVRGLAALELVQLYLDRGAVDDATRAFGLLERLVADQLPGPVGALWVMRMGTALALELGDHADAQRRSESIDDAFWGPFARAKVNAALGRGEVLALLDDAVPRCPRHHVMRTMFMACATDDRDAASELADRAVSIASLNGMLQTLASTGGLDLIERAAWRLPAPWMDRLRRATANTQSETTPTVRLIEPLTVRERDVLRFLPSRLTLKEIADELYVSVNTLKFHLKVIYRKLGVNSRAEAAELARTWGRIESN